MNFEESKKFYVNIPSKGAVYEVTPGCCVLKVVYGGEQLGIWGQNDDEDNRRILNSWDLECRCDLKTPVVVVSKEYFREKYDYVLSRNDNAA